ncbi:22156_t:CDS:1, partial [Racocetra persica]
IIKHNLYNIIDNKKLYIERFGEIIKDFEYPVYNYIDYEEIEQAKEDSKKWVEINPYYKL